MISVSDILKILDQVPIWKSLRELPKRMEALENRVRALEQKAAAPPKTPMRGRECSGCGEEMKLVSEDADPVFDALGGKLHRLECPACGFKSERKFMPGQGYI